VRIGDGTVWLWLECDDEGRYNGKAGEVDWMPFNGCCRFEEVGIPLEDFEGEDGMAKDSEFPLPSRFQSVVDWNVGDEGRGAVSFGLG
jgi:hypothetical protein